MSGHTLPDLTYPYDGLEPYISRQIMELHHKKHHQTYVNALNAAEQAYAKTSTPKERIALQAALKFNGGGAATGGELRDGPLKVAILERWGTFEKFKQEFNTTTAGIQGSGWGWLGLNPATGKLEIVTTANQDPLLSHVPIIGVDIWEHAFYLQYLNVKVDYLNAIWNVIDFQEAEKRFVDAGGSSKL
ncbi:manganese superoxide dismutase [Lactarius sanguifluus]|nr:manganese superoxide dismutase [Lactarius sanguifluus]